MSTNEQHAPNRDMHTSQEAYELWHEKYSVDEESDTPWHRLVKKHLVVDRDISGCTILEIGCGRGGFACWLATRSATPDGIVAADFSEVAIKKAETFALQSNVRGIRWQVQDIQHLDFPTASFDVVVSCETIEHVPNPRLALQELGRVLKPSGRLFLTCPNYLGPMGLYRGYLRARGRRFTEEGQPINNFLLLPATVKWITRAGLRVERIDGVGHYIPFPGRRPINVPISHPKVLLKWFAQHSLIIAKK